MRQEWRLQQAYKFTWLQTDLTLDDIYRVDQMYGILPGDRHGVGIIRQRIDVFGFFAAGLELHALDINDSSHVAR